MSETKKRKRDSENDEQPRTENTLQGTIRVHTVEGDDEWCPLLGSSPGLALPNNLSLQTYKKKTGGSVLSDPRIVPPGYKSKPAGYELLLYSTSHPKLDFIGREEAKQESTKDDDLRHYVGIYDPETSTVQVVPSRKMTFRHVPRLEALEMREAAAEAAKERATLSAQRQELGLEFGSKRAKKVISANAQNAIAPTQGAAADEKLDALGSALLTDAAAATKDQPNQEAMQAQQDAGKPRPKANLQAQKPADVYTVENLIGGNVMKALGVGEWIDHADQGVAVHTSSRFVANRIRTLATGTRKDVQKLKVLKYLATLLDFHGSLKSGSRGTKALPKNSELKERLKTSEIVLNHIVQSFTESGNVGKWGADYLYAHICALALIVDNFEVIMGDLQLDLKLDENALVQHFRELGCQVRAPNVAEKSHMKSSKAAGGGVKVAVLKLPLDFPVQRPKRRRR
ncbi:MAG: DNA-directed RNA polymerase I subunit rpa49 [Bathelium mastoideum]|nr:MAG: DNA-directed RNA polymerase I subunit rpa49 [Bathelium mastoideum]